MLSSIRKFSKSFLAKVFVAIIALPFVLWGMGDIFSSGKQNVIVEINKDKISSKEFISYVENVKLNSDEINKIGKSNILDQILTSYISNKIISLEQERKKIKLTDKSLRKILMNDKNFQRDGNFSETEYEKFMITTGYSKPIYEKRIRDMELKGQLLSFYSGGIKLPNFIINDQFIKDNMSKHIEYLDLNKVYSKNVVNEEDIKTFYEKNKDFFKEKYKKLRYVELTPEILTGKSNFDEEYFKKIDLIENRILDGEKFENILPELKGKFKNIGFVNNNKILENGEVIKGLDDNLFEKIFSIKNNNTPEFLDFNNKYYMAELLDQKEITTPLSNQNLKKTIKSQLKITNTIEENNNILKKIKAKNFGSSEMFKLSKDNNVPIEKTIIKNINDKSRFKDVLIKEIYKFNKGQIFILSDSILKDNYLVKVTKEDMPKINKESESYKKNISKSNDSYIKKFYKSYDKYINDEYQVEVNNKVFERIKNSF